jgi:caffeoyl-CoA O-methyltransferase
MKELGQNSPDCYEYALKTFNPEDKILHSIVEKTKTAGMPEIQVGPMEGLLLETMVRATGAKKIVEIGALAGYSAICMARGLPAGGKLWTFEFSEKHALVAQENFHLAGLSSKIQLLLGPALERLPQVESEGPFDLIFIDADKNNYPNYLKWAVKHVRVGGTILADNTFAWGQVGQTEPDFDKNRQPMVEALREYNKAAADHPQLRTTIIPTYEGMTFSVRVS